MFILKFRFAFSLLFEIGSGIHIAEFRYRSIFVRAEVQKATELLSLAQ